MKIYLVLPALAILTGASFANAQAPSAKPCAHENTPAICYTTQEKRQVVEMSSARWKALAAQENGRWDYFAKIFYANTRTKSNNNLSHVACFSGDPKKLVSEFFNTKDPHVTMAHVDADKLNVSVSADEKAIGISFAIKNDVIQRGVAQLKDQTWHFRLNHCTQSGKVAMFDENLKLADYNPEKEELTRSVAAEDAPDVEKSVLEDGFQIFDKPAGKAATFKLRADYSALKNKADAPWAGMDLSNAAQAEKFALLMQQYFYENMATQDKSNPDNNFIAQKNTKRDWCHMPWLNVGESGREGLHGLTKERDLNPSPIYKDATPGSDWGIGYYNGPGCKAIGRAFGSAGKAKANPDFSMKAVGYEDGTVSAKILFTTADFPGLKGAYTWNANVSNPGSTKRSVSSVRHVQMDISVKDSRLKGTNPALGNWVMLTYYYDAKYNSPLKIDGLPEGLKHMRPMGVQSGFEVKDSRIFAGAATNTLDGSLNGPADNPKSSCLGCHGTAGTKKGMVPGFAKNADYSPFAKTSLDFSQQMALAKRNFETKSKTAKK